MSNENDPTPPSQTPAIYDYESSCYYISPISLYIAIFSPFPSLTPNEFYRLRRRHMLTQKEVATFMNDHLVVGLHRKFTDRTISRWENNKSRKQIPFYAIKGLVALIDYKRQQRIEFLRDWFATCAKEKKLKESQRTRVLMCRRLKRKYPVRKSNRITGKLISKVNVCASLERDFKLQPLLGFIKEGTDFN